MSDTKTQTRKFQVGDFVSYQWGYEQTNTEFYRVVRLSKASVWLQRVESEFVEATGPFSSNVRPLALPYERFGETAPIFRKKRQKGWRGDEIVTFEFGVGTICDAGSIHHSSWGH